MTVQRFALAGLVSGVISALALAIPGSFHYVPSVAIGIALAVARRSSVAVSALFVVGSALAWLAMCVIGVVILHPLEDVPPVGFWPLVALSVTGPVLFVLAYCLVFRPHASVVLFVFVTPIAVLLALIGFGVNLIAHCVLKEPEASLFGFGTFLIIWQTGVAVAIGWSEQSSRFMPEDNEGREQTCSPNQDLPQIGHEGAGSPSIERIEP